MNALQRALSLHGADDGPLAAGTAGGSTGVALFHGFTSGPVSVTGWARALAAAGAHVEVPLLPGHGTRWEDLESVVAAEWRSAARNTVDALLAVHERVVVGGLSMGGALALDAAAHRPVSGVIVVNPALRFASRAAPLAGLLRYLVRTVAPIAGDAVRPDVDEQAYPRTPVRAVHQVGLLQAAARSGLGRVECPVLAFRSGTDRVVPPACVDLLGRSLPSGRLQVRPLYNSGHVATLDWDAEIIEDESVRFIATLPSGRVRAHD